jgi:mRNA interferase HigB
MRVIAKSTLSKFWKNHSGAESPLTHWYNHVNSKAIDWTSFGDVKKDFENADKVGDCYVFNVGGNNYRLIAKILRERVYVLKIMTHREYSKQKWIGDCGCRKKLRKDIAKTKKMTKRKK